MERFGSPSEEHQPITWLNGYPVYAAHLIVVVYVVSMIATSVCMAFGSQAPSAPPISPVEAWLRFDSDLIFRGQLWRYLTYGFWNPPSLGFAINMFWLALFGREVEKFFGRVIFLRLYFVIYLLTPLLFTLLGRWGTLRLEGASGCFAVFIAFATLYPGAVLMFNVLAKWAAIILVGVFSFSALAYHDSLGLLSLWVTVLFAYGFVRYHQGHFNLPTLNFRRRRPKLRVLPDLEKGREEGFKTPQENSMAEVDALLDKIAQSGIGSLTAKERAKLDRARDDLRNRGTRRS